MSAFWEMLSIYSYSVLKFVPVSTQRVLVFDPNSLFSDVEEIDDPLVESPKLTLMDVD